MARLCALVAAMLVALVGTASALAAPATTAGADEGRRVALPVEFVYDFQTAPYICAQCGPGGTPIELIGCGYAVFVQFPVVARATSYRVVVADHHPRVNVVRDLVGPPFNDDVEGYKAPAGTHRFGGLTGGSFTVGEGSPCPPAGDATQNGRFELLESYATIPDDGKLHVSGTVRDADGKGVAGVRVSVGSKKDTTDASGGYDVVVKKGTYTVSAAGGYCVVGKPGCATSTRVKLPPSRTVDFEPPAEHTLSGTVLEQTCAQTCTKAGLAGVTVRATGGPGGPEETTTAADGTYALTLPEGTWRVTPALGEREFQRLLPSGEGNGEGFASVRLGGDETGVDFATCGSAGAASGRRLQASPICEVDLVVEGIELTNGIQETTLQDLTDGQGGLFSDAVDYEGIPLVAGRPAVVRVFVSTIAQREALGEPKVAAFEGAENVPVQVEVRQGSRLLSSSTVRVRSVDVWPVLPGARLNRVGSVAEVLIPGHLVRPGPFEVTVKLNPIDPVSSKQAIDECRTRACKDDNRVSVRTQAVETTPPKVVLVQLATKPDGVISSTWSGEGANQLWPVATDALAPEAWRGAPLDVTRTVIRAGEPSGSFKACLAVAACAGALVNELVAKIKTWYVAANRPAGYYLAPMAVEFGGIRGATSARFPVTWTITTDYSPIHELMHQFGLLHADSGLPAGCGGGDNGQQQDPGWPAGRGIIRGYGVDLGPDLFSISRLIGPPDAWYDVMSYCRARGGSGGATDTWASTINWKWLLGFLSESGIAGRALAGAPASSLLVDAAVAADGSVQILGLTPTDLAPDAPAATPTHTVVVRDAAGAVLASLPVAAEAAFDGGRARIEAIVPAAAAERIEIASPQGTTLASRSGSTTAPTVAIAAPARGARLVAGKALRVAWTATASDGVALQAAVDLSVDGGSTWRTVAAAIDDTAVSIPAAALTRSNAAQLRVRVSDGFVEASAVVTGLKLAGALPRVRIVAPFGRREGIVAGARAVLRAVAADDANRPIVGKRLRWLEGKRVLGTGATLTLATLKAGTHVVRLVATDGAGRSASATIRIRVAKAAPAKRR